ncbi:receptor-like protein kinase [Quercus suber]|uniref:Receptor-like protein kinase n=2 Tax=Quercus suber TaxID=58331 RepID=A0AAW0LS64_QUESU
MDPKMEGIYDNGKIEILVEMALQCLEEDKDERPTMKQVVKKLSSP